MTVISMRDYATKHGVSYQAIWKMANKYEKELEGHISTQNRTRYLDEEAQAFLDERRRVSPIVVIEETSKEEKEKLRQELEERDTIIKELQARIISLQDEKMSLIADKAKAELYLEDKAKTEAELVKTTEELTDTKIKLAEAEKEAQSYHKSFFGLYKKS